MRKPKLPRITQPLIRRMVKRIVEQFDPEQVILFGSQARGDAGTIEWPAFTEGKVLYARV